MALFQYPKSKHVRQLAPRQFKHYRSYKRFLQREFARVCVYCRQPDSSAPNLNFGVDHYRPKALPQFSDLVCEYSNLYYCCGSCNSRKSNYWPQADSNGPMIIAPCDCVMTDHLRFNASTGRVEPKTHDGTFTAELLQLNDEAVVSFRKSSIYLIRLLSDEVDKLKRELRDVQRELRAGKLSNAEFISQAASIQEDIDLASHTIQKHTGDVPLPDLPTYRFGVQLTSS